MSVPAESLDRAREALAYHQAQVKTANAALILFLVVLVGFTLYRVHIEWTLSQSIRSSEDLERSIEQAKKLEQDRLSKQTTLNFILGRDTQGSPINPRRIRRDAGAVISKRLEDDAPRDLVYRSPIFRDAVQARQLASVNELHNLYSPFFKECTFSEAEGKISVAPQMPLEFLAKAQAEIGLRLLSERNIEPDRVFCANELTRGRTTISPAGEAKLKELVNATTLANRGVSGTSERKAPPPEVCLAIQAAARQLSEISLEGWYPGIGREPNQYMDPGQCKLNTAFQDDYSQAQQLLSQLNSRLAIKFTDPELPIREGEAQQMRALLDYSALQQILRSASERQSDGELSKIRALQGEAQTIKAAEDKLKSFRPARQDDKSTADSFSLYQLLLGALFVFSALTASLTAAFVSRAHSFEIVEIERFLRWPQEFSKVRPMNPFSKSAGSKAEMPSFHEILGLFKRNQLQKAEGHSATRAKNATSTE